MKYFYIFWSQLIRLCRVYLSGAHNVLITSGVATPSDHGVAEPSENELVCKMGGGESGIFLESEQREQIFILDL